MDLDWSEQSSHIRTLYRPWQPGDGYDEATLQATEMRLDLRLPAPLRAFYLAWGRRRDLTQTYDFLGSPEELVMKADTLIICAENQVVAYWGVQREALHQVDPPVVVTPSGPSGWEVASELHWTPSHRHLSGFLDDLTYQHAFDGGALHGGYTALYPHPPCSALPAHHIAWLEEGWHKAKVGSKCFHAVPSDSAIEDTWPPVYVRDGQAFCELAGSGGVGPAWRIAAREAKVVDEIGQRFQITWARRW